MCVYVSMCESIRKILRQMKFLNYALRENHVHCHLFRFYRRMCGIAYPERLFLVDSSKNNFTMLVYIVVCVDKNQEPRSAFSWMDLASSAMYGEERFGENRIEIAG